MTEEITLPMLRSWLFRFGDDLRVAESHLNQLDALSGDGEHGSNLSRGVKAFTPTLHDKQHKDVRGLLESVGMAIVNSVGGASGALFGTFFLRLSDVGDTREGLDLRTLKIGLNSALDGIRELGRAEPGDKTLVDSLHPAVAALQADPVQARGLRGALECAAAAAEAGRDATGAMTARMGRGSYVGDRGRGHVDAGATSMAMLLRTLSDTYSSSAPNRGPGSVASHPPDRAL